MKGTIELEQMEFYAYHGCYAEEQRVGNKFMVNISFRSDCSFPAHSDDISDAVNYVEIYNIIREQMMIKSHLLENVASRIKDSILNKFASIEGLNVKVSKMNPPVGGQMKCVSVTVHQ